MTLRRAIILAAGVGSRLRPLTDDCPKCLLDVGGRPIVDRQVGRCACAASTMSWSWWAIGAT